MILQSACGVFNFPNSCFASSSHSSDVACEKVHIYALKKHSKSYKRKLVCVLPSDGTWRNVNVDFIKPGRNHLKGLCLKNVNDELESDRISKDLSVHVRSSFTNFPDDPVVDSLRTELGVILPIPSYLFSARNVGLFALFFIFGVLFDKIWKLKKKKYKPFTADGLLEAQPQVPTGYSLFLKKDFKRKESVEWVNMVLEKLWQVYRNALENWVTGSLQPAVENLEKPDYVERVDIEQFSLGDEPLSVRTVERRTSRRVNDLQYQIGIRYAGGARMLLKLSLKFGIIPIIVPISISDFDIDGEIWIKLQLIDKEPWVGAVSWAFVSLPKIKIFLSPFRLFNLMSIPILSMFLTKLLTEDLPSLFVLPNKNVVNIDNTGRSSEEIQENIEDFAGELSVTLVNASNLSYFIYGKSDPYVIFNLGDQSMQSKRNSQTSIVGPPGEPVWNQDFHFLVLNPKKQKLFIHIKDSVSFADLTIGSGEVEIGSLQDTVPTDRVVVLQRDWGPFSNIRPGEILLRLTYKSYVEDEDDDNRTLEPLVTNAPDKKLLNSSYKNKTSEQALPNYSTMPDRESLMDILAAILVSQEFQQIIASETTTNRLPDHSASLNLSSASQKPSPTPVSSSSQGSGLFWLAVITSMSLLLAMNIGSGSGSFNP